MKKFFAVGSTLFAAFLTFGQSGSEQEVYYGEGVFLGETPPIILDKSPEPDFSNVEAHEGPVKENRRRPEVVNFDALPQGEDPIRQKNFGTIPAKSTVANFNGLLGGFPPDPSGAAGPNHYVQAINTAFRIYDKTGQPITPSKNLNTLWPGSSNSGDPIVMYDRNADRWVITQFQTGSNEILYAVSSTPDPTGTYYTYAYSFPTFPDYPKYSIWSDGYYMTSNTSQRNVAVFNRDSMLVGAQTAPFVALNLPGFATDYGFRSVLPADADGELPPYGTPNYMFLFQDDAWGGASQDEIRILKMEVDWDNQTASISLHQSLYPSPFNAVFTPQWNDITQKGTNQKIDAIASVFNYRAQYMRWGSYNTVMLCNVVDIDNNNTAGIRWYELRQDESTDQFEVFQEGTYAPADGQSRFLGSIGMDINGNIGMGYSLSGPDHYPSLCFTGRYKNDPLGEMTVQETMTIAGVNAQQNGNRFGDYAHLALDPDGTTFWYTGEFISSGASRRTRIFAFNLTDIMNTPENLADQYEIVVSQSQGAMTIAMEDVNETELELNIYAASGKLMKYTNAELVNGRLELTLDTSTWSTGMYIVAVNSKNFRKTTKVMVE